MEFYRAAEDVIRDIRLRDERINALEAELRMLRADKERYHGGLFQAHGELHIDGRTTNLGPVQCEYCLAAHDAIHIALGCGLQDAAKEPDGDAS